MDIKKALMKMKKEFRVQGLETNEERDINFLMHRLGCPTRKHLLKYLVGEKKKELIVDYMYTGVIS